MAPKRNTPKVPILLCDGGLEHKFHDISNHNMTALHPKHETDFTTLNSSDVFPGGSGTTRTRSLVLGGGNYSSMLSSTVSEEGLEFKSDADSPSCQELNVGGVDDEDSIDELLSHEGPRKKLRLLAEMVGADAAEPGFVLAEVVTVLKGLQGRYDGMSRSYTQNHDRGHFLQWLLS